MKKTQIASIIRKCHTGTSAEMQSPITPQVESPAVQARCTSWLCSLHSGCHQPVGPLTWAISVHQVMTWMSSAVRATPQLWVRLEPEGLSHQLFLYAKWWPAQAVCSELHPNTEYLLFCGKIWLMLSKEMNLNPLKDATSLTSQKGRTYRGLEAYIWRKWGLWLRLPHHLHASSLQSSTNYDILEIIVFLINNRNKCEPLSFGK